MVDAVTAPTVRKSLTEEQRAILLMLASGRTPKQIARALRLNTSAFAMRLMRLREERSAATNVQLVAEAICSGELRHG